MEGLEANHGKTRQRDVHYLKSLPLGLVLACISMYLRDIYLVLHLFIISLETL